MKLRAEFENGIYYVYEDDKYTSSILARYKLNTRKKLILVACKDLSKEKEAREFLKQFVEVREE